jgi:hypothetical protein
LIILKGRTYIDIDSRRSAAELDELFERKVRPWRFHKETTMTQRLVEEKAQA